MYRDRERKGEQDGKVNDCGEKKTIEALGMEREWEMGRLTIPIINCVALHRDYHVAFEIVADGKRSFSATARKLSVLFPLPRWQVMKPTV